jgi:hypothetical protein
VRLGAGATHPWPRTHHNCLIKPYLHAPTTWYACTGDPSSATRGAGCRLVKQGQMCVAQNCDQVGILAVSGAASRSNRNTLSLQSLLHNPMGLLLLQRALGSVLRGSSTAWFAAPMSSSGAARTAATAAGDLVEGG